MKFLSVVFKHITWLQALWVMVLVVVLVTVVVVVTNSSVLKSQTLSNHSSRLPILQQNTPTPTADIVYLPLISQSDPINPTLKWQTHEDMDRGFRIKYPSTWHLDYSPRQGNRFDFNGVTTITNYDPSPSNRDRTYFQLTANDLKILIYWASNYPFKGQVSSNSVQEKQTVSGLSILSSSEVQINAELSAHYVIGQDNSPQGQGDLLKIYYIPHIDQVFVISAKPANSIHQPTLEALVGTLEFIN
jgi:hypothetical protein